MWVGDMGVDLGGCYVAVPKHGLYGADVGSVHKQVGSKRVAQGMGSNFFGYSGK